MLILQNLTYTHPNKDLLFDNIYLTVNQQDKIALIGNNGAGKSTLLKIIAGILQPSGGTIHTNAVPYYIPQIFGQFNGFTIAKALQIEDKLKALKEILDGKVTEENLTLLNDDWGIEERCADALNYWGLGNLDLTQEMSTLSGGQKTKVFLAGIAIHQPEIVLLDEPSNHLDRAGRELLYQFIQDTSSTLIVVSHDRKLLNLLDTVCELSKRGITVYGGNYEFYAEQKEIEGNALDQDIRSKEKALRKARETERETAEKQQKLDARGKKKQEKAGLPTISMNTFRNNAEKSTARMKGVHAEKVDSISQGLNELRKELPDMDKMKLGFDNSTLHRGKILFTAKDINYNYGKRTLWQDALNLQITSGERIALKGLNGAGKTTLINIILGKMEPSSGTVSRADNKTVYIDQDYSLINDDINVYEQAQQFNLSALQEHEIKIRLTRFLFTKDYWDKPCHALSGGEKMRLMLCCLTISDRTPDIIVLDEPTNNLDIQNIEILTAAVNEYRGTLIVVSHDEYFLEEINVERVIELH
ncbi:ribosomal protection-like ABC-F family protein [Chitinophaga sp. S165]|uniref:ribosomal protection-like ABC-F family protein n=1 Tax=Chitinophaga sp. S165 TaxID=2135462 RepID=UPI000D71533A|nr:ABC-F family ATP-binding cassette domain-containing protein [Chitinophaga sp. S165]PWV54317.1 ATPase subunit of ABC transporter with duplicated ATPase domains [Chitinophaga sp. S165]